MTVSERIFARGCVFGRQVVWRCKSDVLADIVHCGLKPQLPYISEPYAQNHVSPSYLPREMTIQHLDLLFRDIPEVPDFTFQFCALQLPALIHLRLRCPRGAFYIHVRI